jgi:hypothetical protein
VNSWVHSNNTNYQQTNKSKEKIGVRSRQNKTKCRTDHNTLSIEIYNNITEGDDPDYTSINAVCKETKINNGDSLRCMADSDASTLWDSRNEIIVHKSNEEHSAASTLCDSSLDSNEDRSAASTIDYDNAAHPFDTLAKLCYILYETITKTKPTKELLTIQRNTSYACHSAQRHLIGQDSNTAKTNLTNYRPITMGNHKTII